MPDRRPVAAVIRTIVMHGLRQSSFWICVANCENPQAERSVSAILFAAFWHAGCIVQGHAIVLRGALRKREMRSSPDTRKLMNCRAFPTFGNIRHEHDTRLTQAGTPITPEALLRNHGFLPAGEVSRVRCKAAQTRHISIRPALLFAGTHPAGVRYALQFAMICVWHSGGREDQRRGCAAPQNIGVFGAAIITSNVTATRIAAPFLKYRCLNKTIASVHAN